jgi:hypothetical protein
VGLDGFGTRDLDLLIYTPEQMDPKSKDPRGTPVGRGAGNKAQTGYDFFWTGSFPIEGTYYIAVVNKTGKAMVYRLTAWGTGVRTEVLAAPTTSEISPVEPRIRASSVQVQIGAAAIDASIVYTIHFPLEMQIPGVSATVPIRPDRCTLPEAIGAIITQTIKLCPGKTYRNLNLVGKGIGLFGDDTDSALVKSDGRSFAVTGVGENLLIEGLRIHASTDPADASTWLCAYEKCGDGANAIPGSTVYGGGVLLKASGSIVKDVVVLGGVTGIATIDSRNNFLINNRLLYQTGWASYNRLAVSTHFLGNAFSHSNRTCVGADRRYYQHGCETAGWLCISCRDVTLVDNECRRSGNCYYINGDGGVPSYNAKFFGNACYGSPNNCYEVTYSRGIQFEQNLAARDPYTGEDCKYPFWIGGSEVVFGRENNWACSISPTTALQRSESSTTSNAGTLRPGSEAP